MGELHILGDKRSMASGTHVGRLLRGDAHPLGDGEGQRVFTAARRFCAAVRTAQSAVTTSAPALGINPAAGGAIPLAALPGAGMIVQR